MNNDSLSNFFALTPTIKKITENLIVYKLMDCHMVVIIEWTKGYGVCVLCVCARACVCAHAHVYVCVCARTCVCTRVRACMYMCISVWYICAYCRCTLGVPTQMPLYLTTTQCRCTHIHTRHNTAVCTTALHIHIIHLYTNNMHHRHAHSQAFI